jgi:hypothetical protein
MIHLCGKRSEGSAFGFSAPVLELTLNLFRIWLSHIFFPLRFAWFHPVCDEMNKGEIW